jgi:chromosomal replication initiator protein
MHGGDASLGGIWERILSVLRPNVSRNFYQTWLRCVRPIALHDDTLTLAVPNDFARSWLEKRAGSCLRKAAHDCLGKPVRLDFVVAQLSLDIPASRATETPTPSSRERHDQPAAQGGADQALGAGLPLNGDHTFENFIVGESNRFAHAAAMAVATSCSTEYNPLFIYGSVGLGKTHLMQAIAHHIRRHSPQTAVLYTTADAFMHQVVNAVRRDGFASFRSLYHGLSVLLFDDVQFIASKHRTETEFFHAFNALHDRKQQIVITCDRPPRELEGIEARLVSRFEWGVITDVKPPDLETRMAILAHKASLRNLQLQDAALRYVASEIQSDVRALEGVISSLALMNAARPARVTLDLASQALRHLRSHQPPPVDLTAIVDTVSNELGVPANEITGARRTAPLAHARQVSMLLARRILKLSFPAIAKAFGGKDHSTVIHACAKIESMERTDPDTSRLLETLSEKLTQRR